MCTCTFFALCTSIYVYTWVHKVKSSSKHLKFFCVECMYMYTSLVPRLRPASVACSTFFVRVRGEPGKKATCTLYVNVVNSELISANPIPLSPHVGSFSTTATSQPSLSSSLEEGGHLHLVLSGLCLSPSPPSTGLSEVDPG